LLGVRVLNVALNVLFEAAKMTRQKEVYIPAPSSLKTSLVTIVNWNLILLDIWKRPNWEVLADISTACNGETFDSVTSKWKRRLGFKKKGVVEVSARQRNKSTYRQRACILPCSRLYVGKNR
jgi:hypothetical protein